MSKVNHWKQLIEITINYVLLMQVCHKLSQKHMNIISNYVLLVLVSHNRVDLAIRYLVGKEKDLGLISSLPISLHKSFW